MAKCKNDVIPSLQGNDHIDNCKQLSKELEAKYIMEGGVDGGYLPEALASLPGTSLAEAAIIDFRTLMKTIIKLYKSNAEFTSMLDKALLDNDVYGMSGVKAGIRLKGMKRFFNRIFNYYTPGYIEMYRLRSNPELFTAGDLQYIRDTFIDMQFVEE